MAVAVTVANREDRCDNNMVLVAAVVVAVFVVADTSVVAIRMIPPVESQPPVLIGQS